MLIVLFAFVAIAIGFVVYFNWIVNVRISNNENKKVFEVKEGTATYTIATNLQNDGYIKSALAFYLYVKIKDITLHSGAYLVSQNMSIADIADKIGDANTAIRKITIPEGWRAEQIAQYLDKENYVKYEDFIKIAKKYEGKLFPDTYYISVESTPDEILNLMLKDYETRIGDLDVKDNDLILASIVEREAKNDNERAKIAGVFKNRLKAGMTLSSDPTVIYANDSDAISRKTLQEILNYVFWTPVSISKYQTIKSNYNTYVNKGLPQGPICNPGIKSIEAALNPETHNYLFFFHDDAGKIYFSETAEEHEEKLNSIRN